MSEQRAIDDWRFQAACRGKDPDLFFPERGSLPAGARELCGSCAVAVECLDYALSFTDVDGVWAGTTRGAGQDASHAPTPHWLSRGVMRGFVDESLRRDGRLYLVAAAVVPPADLGGTRAAVERVLLPGQRRFHWRDETDAQRQKMLGVMIELGVAVHAFCSALPRREDRARAKCVERLLWELGERGVDHLVFESREDHNDAKDRRTIIRAQKAGGCRADLAYEFSRPEGEPLLWLADAAAGAVAAHVAGEAGGYFELLGPAVAGLDRAEL